SPLTTATIAAKLAASEREADAARVRAKLKAARLARTGRGAVGGGNNPVLPPPPSSGNTEGDNGSAAGEPVKRDREREEGRAVDADGEGRTVEGRMKEGVEVREIGGKRDDADGVDLAVPVERPRKRERRTSKAASRRRSTLNPWELQSLIQGDVGAAAAAGAIAEGS
ncbi:hypothetical protein NKR19_g7405, partial [Coniochaeta hoffmannii]